MKKNPIKDRNKFTIRHNDTVYYYYDDKRRIQCEVSLDKKTFKLIFGRETILLLPINKAASISENLELLGMRAKLNKLIKKIKWKKDTQ